MNTAFNKLIELCFILGGSTLAVYLQVIIFSLQKISFACVYAGVIGILTAVSLFFCPLGAWVPDQAGLLIVSAPAGWLIGYLAARADSFVIRIANRKRITNYRLHPGPQPKPSGSNRDWASYANNRAGFLFPLLLIAAGEEILFRGVLLNFCLAAGSLPLISFWLLCLVLAFALIHIQMGWPNVLAKIPLSLLTTLSVLLFKGVLVAIIAHGVFNSMAWEQLRNRTEHKQIHPA